MSHDSGRQAGANLSGDKRAELLEHIHDIALEVIQTHWSEAGMMFNTPSDLAGEIIAGVEKLFPARP